VIERVRSRKNGANSIIALGVRRRGGGLPIFAPKFLESLRVPTGPLAGRRLRLAPYQAQFLAGALAEGVSGAALSVARGGGKSALTAGIALGHLLGKIDPQVARECLVCARTRDQGRIVYDYVLGLSRSLPAKTQQRLTWRKAPRLEVEYAGPDGSHVLRVLPADGRTALGTSPTLAIADERAHWREAGEELEHAIISGLGKRSGRYIAISTSAPDDAHPFSRMLDDPPPGYYVQEHRADDGCAPDDIDQIRKANPGAEHGVGASLEWLQAQARRAIQRGGSALSSWRLYNLNQRVSGETRDVLLTVDQWLACESADVPPRNGPVVVGIDLGGSASMSAATYYWPQSGRMECRAWFPSKPGLRDRGEADGVSGRYVEMNQRGELAVIGELTVPVSTWVGEVMQHVAGETVSALVADRYKQSEIGEAIDKACIRVPVIWRGMGFKDGGEDCERFRRACFDGRVHSVPSLLLRSAFADAVCLRDPANNIKLTKARARGRIDAASASVLAVAEGARIAGRAAKPKRAATWV
jgi:phage terminase large subunit-like protein